MSATGVDPPLPVPAAAAAPTAGARELLQGYWTPRRAAWSLAALGFLLRVWVVSGGWFYWDDYIFQGRAWQLPLDAEYLLHPHDGHLMPAAFALQWPLTHQWPMTYLPLAGLLVAGQLVVTVVSTRLLLVLFPGRWLVLVPVAVVAVSPLTLPTNTWWAAALNGIPLQASLAASLLGIASWLRGRGRRHLVWPLAVWVVALAFTEKAVLVPVVALASLAVLAPRPWAAGTWWRAARRSAPVWVLQLLGVAAYAAFYLSEVGKTPAADAAPGQVADLVARGVVSSAATGLAGGPLRWTPVGFGSALGDPPWWWVLVVCEALVVLVVWSCAASRRARWAWAWAALVLALDLGLVASGRLNGFVDPTLVQGLRYTADAALPLAIVLGVALAAVAPSARRAWSGSWRPWAPRALVLCAVAVLVAASALSTARYRELWAANDSRIYVANAERSLAQAAEGPPLVDMPVPTYVLYGLAYPYNQASWLLGPVSPRPDFADPTTELRILDDFGVLRPALIDGPGARPGPVPGCGWLVRGAGDIPLASRIVDFPHTVRVGYLASGEGTASLALGAGEAREVPVHRGLHEVVVTLAGGGTDLRVRDLTPGVTVCTDDVRVGVPVVAEAP